MLRLKCITEFIKQVGEKRLINLTLCMLGNFSCLCCHLLTFLKPTFSQNSLRNIIRVSNGLDPDQDRCFVGPDLGPNYLQRLSADDKKHR